MNVCIDTITNSKTFEFNGSEEWLENFYEAFPTKKENKLTGSVTLTPDEYEHCAVSGTVDFQVEIKCTRCTAPISHTIDNSFSMLFRPAKYDLNANEVELSSGELEANYMNEKNEIDLCQLLIDHVNDATPDFQHCSKCAKKSFEGPIYKSENDDKLNPFAKLKDLKLPN